MKLLKAPVLLLSMLISSQALSAETGAIADLIMSGPDDPNHPNMIQIDFGDDLMTTSGCNQRYAGIRKNNYNSHLTSLAIAALMSNQAVYIELNPDDVYLESDSRCVIDRISLANYSTPVGEPPSDDDNGHGNGHGNGHNHGNGNGHGNGHNHGNGNGHNHDDDDD